jgi:hypothetical protein
MIDPAAKFELPGNFDLRDGSADNKLHNRGLPADDISRPNHESYIIGQQPIIQQTIMAWWRSGYRARLEILFLRERRFESCPRRSFCDRYSLRDVVLCAFLFGVSKCRFMVVWAFFGPTNAPLWQPTLK